jgi:hypothetical protein
MHVTAQRRQHRKEDPPRAWTLQHILAPNGVGEFKATHWGRLPLFVNRASPEFYDGLFALSDLERYLGQRGMFRRHVITTPEEGFGIPLPPPASLGELMHRLAEGTSMRIRSLEQFLDPAEPVMQLVRDIERSIAHQVTSVSAYLTPGGGRGLGPHHDDSEIFTLQITGQKTWRIYRHVSSREPGTYDRAELGQPAAEITLSPGDLFFCPAGWVHDVTVNARASLSLTLVFEPFRGLSMIDLLCARLGRSPAFLATLPVDRDGESFTTAFNELKLLAQQALEDLRVEELSHLLDARVLAGIGESRTEQLRAAVCCADLDDGSVMVRDPAQAYHIGGTGDRMWVTLPNGDRFPFHSNAERELRRLLSAEGPVRLGSIQGLEPGRERELRRALLLSGLMQIVAS